jgi:ubiquinone/menaquinone biosynthesis C-methylase UbiE
MKKKMVDPQGKIRLNIGSGKSYDKDYLNVDINPVFKPDIVADINEITFPDESFIEVSARDCLDHMSPVQTRKLLRFIRKWLKPKGTLVVHLPNLDFLVKSLYLSENEVHRHEALRWLYGTDGTGNTNYFSNHIQWCYNKKSFKQLLKDIGFEMVGFDTDCLGFGMGIIARKK